MKKARPKPAGEQMRDEYDFTGGVRGKYYERFRAGTNLVLLEPDVSADFPDSASVNQALRELATVARRNVRVMRRPANPKRRPNKKRGLGRRR